MIKYTKYAAMHFLDYGPRIALVDDTLAGLVRQAKKRKVDLSSFLRALDDEIWSISTADAGNGRATYVTTLGHNVEIHTNTMWAAMEDAREFDIWRAKTMTRKPKTDLVWIQK